jgi:hypothetical protein
MLRDEYISPADGRTWREVYQEVENDEPELEVGLHDVHRHIMLDKIDRSRCSVCHTRPPFYPVLLGSSTGGDGLEAISCGGCHGRNEDAGNDSISGGLGAGLRQHHTNAGVTECKTCHADADPANYTPVGEDVLPSYYARLATKTTPVARRGSTMTVTVATTRPISTASRPDLATTMAAKDRT